MGGKVSERKYTVIETDVDGYKRSYELTQEEILEKMNKEVSVYYLKHEDWRYGWSEHMECDWQSIPELFADNIVGRSMREKRAMNLFKEMKEEMADDLTKLVKEQDFARRQIQHYEAQIVEFEILTRNSREEEVTDV
tara:strand:+ start:391 stop:801 length:411 start_codon:yes stop_codon:yes gene_type:complete